MDSILALNRMSGILLWGPSFMGNLTMLNCLFVSEKFNFTKRMLLGSTILSIVADQVMVVALVGWFINNNWAYFTILSVVLGIIKRTYSIASVSMLLRRFEALVLKQKVSQRQEIIYLGLYVVLSFITMFFHIYSYAKYHWNGTLTRGSVEYKVYRIMNMVAGLYYFVIGFYTDFRFFLTGKKVSVSLNERIQSMKVYHNIYLFMAYEVILFAAFMITAFWCLWDINVNATNFIEQCLLTFITTNAFYTVYNPSESEGGSRSLQASGIKGNLAVVKVKKISDPVSMV